MIILNQSTNKPSSSALSEQKGGQPKGWRVFGQNRALFVPVANRAVQSYALNFFLSSKWQRIAIWLATRLGLGRKVSEGAGKEWREIADTLTLAEDISGDEKTKGVINEQIFYAMRQGSKGPYQKTSLIAVKQSGCPVFYAKVATGESADVMVEAESTCLQRLSLIDSLKGMVPQRINFGKTPSGRAFFTTTVASTLKTNNRFQSQHEKFLSTLGHATVQSVLYANSVEFLFVQSALQRLRQVLGIELHAELESAAHDILSKIGDLKLPIVLAHRDFAPWNIRWHQSGVFVFDWEYAAEGANPLYDFFHFHLIQQALSSRSNASISAYGLTLVPSAIKYLKQYYPEVNWSLEIARHLLLAYLVDLILFYVDSEKQYNASHPVLAAYINLIKQLKLSLVSKCEVEI